MTQTVDAFVGVYSINIGPTRYYVFIHICVRPLYVCSFYYDGQARASMRGTSKRDGSHAIYLIHLSNRY